MIAQYCELKVMSEGLVSIVETNFPRTPSFFFQETQEQSGSSDSQRQKKGKNGGAGATSPRVGAGGIHCYTL